MKFWGVAVALIAIGAIALFAIQRIPAQRPDIAFGPTADPDLADPDNRLRVYPYDLARLEQEFPLTRAQMLQLTPGNLKSFTQDELDQIYGRLSAGPIPDGPFQGSLIFPRGGAQNLVPRLQEVLGGIGGKIAAEKIETVEKVGEVLWKGKSFNRETKVLRNFIEDLAVFGPLIDDPGALETAVVPRGGWLGWLRPTTTVRLMFPAKIYCGQSLMDGRRESVIIDYAYADELPGYQANPDALAGRNGLRVRDEIRMIRPGLYLGRAYTNRIFLLNFFLYNEEIANAGAEAYGTGSPVTEECWVGEQLRQTLLQ